MILFHQINGVVALGLTMIWFAGPLLQTHFDIKNTYIVNIRRFNMNNSEHKDNTSIFTIYGNFLHELFDSFKSVDPWRTVVFVSFYFILLFQNKNKYIYYFFRHLGVRNGFLEPWFVIQFFILMIICIISKF